MKLNFNANEVEPQTTLGPIPAGTYDVAIVEATQRENSGNEGSHLATVLEVQDGEYKGRKLFHNINLWNESAKSREFAEGTLSAICHATGVMQLEDTDQLVGIPMRAEVRLGKSKDARFGEVNSIAGYAAVEEAGSDDASLIS